MAKRDKQLSSLRLQLEDWLLGWEEERGQDRTTTRGSLGEEGRTRGGRADATRQEWSDDDDEDDDDVEEEEEEEQ